MSEEYVLCKDGEELGPHQPGLEFLGPDGQWVESGIIFGRCNGNFVGKYRYKITEEDKIDKIL